MLAIAALNVILPASVTTTVASSEVRALFSTLRRSNLNIQFVVALELVEGDRTNRLSTKSQ
jgi:hypothetical protein